MRKLLVGILVLGGSLAANEATLAQCCRMPVSRFFQPGAPLFFPTFPYFPNVTAYPSPPLLSPVYPSSPIITANPSPLFQQAIPQKTNLKSSLPKQAVTREFQTLVRSPGELEGKAQELFDKGIKAEEEGNLFYAGTCFYHGFTFYRETSTASRARDAYTRVEAKMERRAKAK